ncbi:PaaI family thioesterase [Pseudaquabacterium pictum]|uniref:Thioesterase n=1 Tax=Pseudaquabacterium pictum TaxID=2315236 RepID=A0A480ALU8_9BURK|nr:PaaI family thioesterase [Rubrivivax pictus]GCL61976.1 thioesterase [Rubrivivax pictus]
MNDVTLPMPVPEGFKPLPVGGDFIAGNGPLYIRSVVQPDGSKVRHLGFRVEQRHTNPMGNCHGGMLATFADMMLPMLAHRQAPELRNQFLPTVSLQIDYLAPSPLGAWVQGEAQVLRTTRNLAFVQGLITADGVPALRVSGIFKIGKPFHPPAPPA